MDFFFFCAMVVLLLCGLGAMLQNFDGHDTGSFRDITGVRRSRVTGYPIGQSSGSSYENWGVNCYLAAVGLMLLMVVLFFLGAFA